MNTRAMRILGAAAGCVSLGAAAAGPVNPPAGPIGPTYKTLTEVEPRTALSTSTTPGDADSVFRITQPGSYYLTGNIIVLSGDAGIEIAASNVTIDLAGYSILGVPGSLDGIRTTGVRDGIAIRGGAVAGMGAHGVDLTGLGTAVGVGHTLEDLRVSGNDGLGIIVGHASVVRRCAAVENGNSGIGAIGDGSTIESCVARGNGDTGIFSGGGSTITFCSAVGNDEDGIYPNNGGTVSHCTASGNGSEGFTTAANSTFTACTARGNGGHGFFLGAGTTIVGCTAALNTLTGIYGINECLIRGNTCDGNGNGGDGAGVYVTTHDNRVEGNLCTGADWGIRVSVNGNFISANTCSGNTVNFQIGNGNVCWVLEGATSGPISGNSGGVSAGATSPHANYAF